MSSSFVRCDQLTNRINIFGNKLKGSVTNEKYSQMSPTPFTIAAKKNIKCFSTTSNQANISGSVAGTSYGALQKTPGTAKPYPNLQAHK